MNQNVYTKEEKDKLINELYKKDYIKDNFNDYIYYWI